VLPRHDLVLPYGRVEGRFPYLVLMTTFLTRGVGVGRFCLRGC
jgi:hypothetical protein